MSNYLVKEFFERELFKYSKYRFLKPFPWSVVEEGLSTLVNVNRSNLFIPSTIFYVDLGKSENGYFEYAELCDNPKYKEILK